MTLLAGYILFHFLVNVLKVIYLCGDAKLFAELLNANNFTLAVQLKKSPTN
jgi:hypothetical protein